MEESAEERRKDLSPDIVTKRAADASYDAVTVTGYLGTDPSDGYVRIYGTARLMRFIQVREDDILDRFSQGDDLTEGRSVILIKPEAKLLLCEVLRAQSLEKHPAADPPEGDAYPWPP
jgi:hypothetical protein